MVPAPVGVLLLGAACAVVLSTGMNYLLSSSSNVIRDIYQKMINPGADPDKMVALQKVFIIIMGFCAFLMIFIPTYYKWEISVLQYAYFAYTMYGVSVTPALLAALMWKRATRQGGLASIVGGAAAAVFFEVLLPRLAPWVVEGGDAFGIPSIYPAAIISIGLLVIVSLMTPAPGAKDLERLFPAAAKAGM
jgi:Na+/proline symporter